MSQIWYNGVCCEVTHKANFKRKEHQMENRINPLTIKRYENELVKMIAYFMTHQNCSLLEAQIRVNSILNSEQVHAKAIDWVEKTNRINSLQ